MNKHKSVIIMLLALIMFSSASAALASNQIIMVIGTEHSSAARLIFYERQANGDFMEILQTDAVVGQKGISRDKREGDKRTPAGTYTLDFAFGTAGNPGTSMEYHRLTADDYWVDDVHSQYYNQFVNRRNVKKDWNSAEHLSSYTREYEYAVAVGYNTNPIVRGAGSAIFLHCLTKGYTSGCIAVSRDDMKMILRRLEPGTPIKIIVQ